MSKRHTLTTTMMTVRLPNADFQQLRDLAAERNTNRHQLVRLAVRKMLASNPSEMQKPPSDLSH